MLSEKAYAKLNLSLDIIGTRPDGYHLLQSVFQEISLHDILSAEKAEHITLSCDRPDVPTDDSNIIIKVAKAFFAYTGIPGGARFVLEKHIPSGAGLGGGSTDGVAALRLLDRLYETRLAKQQMVELVAPIGADLPFFVYGGTALVEGIGEKVTPLPPLTVGAFLLVKPPVFMSTPAIYKIYDSLENAIHPDTEKMLSAIKAQDIFSVAKTLGNSLQSAGEKEYDFIIPLAERLVSFGALGAALSGSGATVFGVLESTEKAEKIAENFKKEDCFCGVFTPIFAKTE